MASRPVGYGNRFQIGRVISNGLDVIAKNFVLCAGLALLIAGLPQILFRGLLLGPLTMPGTTTPNPALIGTYFSYIGLLSILNIALSAFLTAALVRAAVEHLSGRKPVIGECLATATRLVVPAGLMSILIGIAGGIGLILLIVPGVILLLGWSVAVPVMVQEKRGILESMSRSRDLARGNKWALFGMYLVLVIAAWVLQALMGMIFVAAGIWVTEIMSGLVAALIAAVTACLSASAYVELREVKEGTSVQELADVFA